MDCMCVCVAQINILTYYDKMVSMALIKTKNEEYLLQEYFQSVGQLCHYSTSSVKRNYLPTINRTSFIWYTKYCHQIM